jgi:signal transduction histidine kinase
MAPEGVIVFVADDGPGIPEEDIAHIFDRFWTARRNARTRGTGMGLAIVRGVMEAHGGRAWVERGESHGATFCLHFPVENTELPSSDAGAANQGARVR